MYESVMQIRWMIPLWMIAFVSVAQARIGESIDQCAERYGPPIEKRAATIPQSDPDAVVFSKTGVTIIIEFRQGSAWHITFRKPSLQAMEVEALINANIGSGSWSPALKYGDREYRLSSDRERLAIASLAGSNITQVSVMLRACARQTHAAYLARLQQPDAIEDLKRKTNPLPGF
jgi:hypothetical protein